MFRRKRIWKAIGIVAAVGAYALLAQYTPPSGSGTITGGSCTNQVATAISNSGVPTCSSVSNAMLAGSIDLTSKVTGVLPAANGGYSPTCLTASTSSSLDFTSVITGTTDLYELVITNLVTATTSTTLGIRVSVDNGSNWRSTSGDYTWHLLTFTAATASNVSTGTEIQITNNSGNPSLVNATVRFYAPATSSGKQQFTGVTYANGNGWDFDGSFTQASAFNAIRIIAGTGNLTSGKACLVGIKNS